MLCTIMHVAIWYLAPKYSVIVYCIVFRFEQGMYMGNDVIAENENYKHLSRCEH